MGHWCPEKREDAIAGGLNHIPVVATDRLDHELERGVNNGARFFRIEVSHKLGRTLDVGEQGGDGLSFTADRFPFDVVDGRRKVQKSWDWSGRRSMPISERGRTLRAVSGIR